MNHILCSRCHQPVTAILAHYEAEHGGVPQARVLEPYGPLRARCRWCGSEQRTRGGGPWCPTCAIDVRREPTPLPEPTPRAWRAG